jgi:hypothetical protein
MKTAMIVLSFAGFACSGCRRVPNGTSIDRVGALKVSDAFVLAVQSDRVDEAVDLTEPEFIQTAGRSRAEGLVRHVFNYCGRPLRLKLKHDETGSAFYKDGRAKPMRKFFYETITSGTKDECTITIEVVPTKNGMKVGRFGSLKPQ